MISYYCQICGVDMAIARIRTPDEPPSAAWNIDGANYVSWFQWPWVDDAEDQECQDCTIVDRTPADAQILQWESLPIWPETDDSDDPDWLPDDNSQPDSEPLEYDSGSEDEPSESFANDSDSDSNIDGDSPEGDKEDNHAGALYPLSELCDRPRPERLPNGTWYNNKIYYTGNRQKPVYTDFPGESQCKVPPEHIASPSCQSLRGINGHVLSLEQMKNCRNVRFLIPKPRNWQSGAEERLLEEESHFYLSGELNGSNLIEGRYFIPWRSFDPPRHGLRELRCSWEMINEGVDGSDVLYPLPVHSYCLDMYAKASYRRTGRVDLDGLWYWREIETHRYSYGIDEKLTPQHPAVLRARESWHLPWHHFPGDEWLVANPAEIPGISELVKSCLDVTFAKERVQPRATLLNLPNELLDQILEHLNHTDLNAAAITCQRMYRLTQSKFRELVRNGMVWLWEILEGSRYPKSPDRPVAWEPLCPLGVPPPSFPVGLEKEEEEAEVWTKIIAEFPEMEDIGTTVKTVNSQRRKEILAPYEERLGSLFQKRLEFRTGVEAWICRSQKEASEVDWRRIWRLFNPATTLIPGMRNRARIWQRCEEIIGYVAQAHKSGGIDRNFPELLAKLRDPSQPGWSSNPDVDGWD